MIRVAVLDDYQGRAPELADWSSLGPETEVAFFRRAIPADELADALADFQVVVLMRERTALPRSVLERLTSLRLVVTTGERNAALDVEYLRERGIPVSGTRVPPRRAGVSPAVEAAWPHPRHRQASGGRGSGHPRGRLAAGLPRPAGRRHPGPGRARPAGVADGRAGPGVRYDRHRLEPAPVTGAGGRSRAELVSGTSCCAARTSSPSTWCSRRALAASSASGNSPR